MKKYFISILLSLVLVQNGYSQPNNPQILSIDKMRQEIRINIGKYIKVENFKDSISSRSVYCQGKELKLIEINYISKNEFENINQKAEWYFSNGHLFYCEQIWTDLLTGTVVNNQKCYIEKDKMIAWYKNDNQYVDNTSQEFEEFQAKLIVYGKTMIEEYK